MKSLSQTCPSISFSILSKTTETEGKGNSPSKMGTSKLCSFFLAILAVHLAISIGSTRAVDISGGGDHFQLGFAPIKSECRGSIAECLLAGGDDEELGLEFAMDSETNRRILATRQYISYGALRRNTVPCSRRGASYYNCRAGAQANPYSRGCSAITRCRRWIFILFFYSLIKIILFLFFV